MIELCEVSKSYPTRSGMVRVLDGIDFTIHAGQHVGILGRNGAGKSTLIRLISGAERPNSGVVRRSMSVSWPLAFGGAFQVSLTGLDNLRFICRVYNVDPEEKIEAVESFSELGVYFREPVRTYSAGMRARLAFAISMAVEFDCFLVDEVIAVGDSRFQRKCHYELFEKRADRARIIVSHDPNIIRQSCERAAVLEKGKLTHFDDVDSAYAFYAERVM